MMGNIPIPELFHLHARCCAPLIIGKIGKHELSRSEAFPIFSFFDDFSLHL
jgi:hypothetical protein